MDSKDDTNRPAGVSTTDHDIGTTGVEDEPTPLQPELEIDVKPNKAEEQYEYVNLQGVFGDILSNKTVEEITRITSNNEQQNYWNILDFIAYNARRDQMINDYILSQYSLKVGLMKFGEGGRKVTMKELQQMLAREVFGETNQDKITYKQKKKALPILLFLTLKRDGRTIKGRACADERKQCVWTDK